MKRNETLTLRIWPHMVALCVAILWKTVLCVYCNTIHTHRMSWRKRVEIVSVEERQRERGIGREKSQRDFVGILLLLLPIWKSKTAIAASDVPWIDQSLLMAVQANSLFLSRFQHSQCYSHLIFPSFRPVPISTYIFLSRQLAIFVRFAFLSSLAWSDFRQYSRFCKTQSVSLCFSFSHKFLLHNPRACMLSIPIDLLGICGMAPFFAFMLVTLFSTLWQSHIHTPDWWESELVNVNWTHGTIRNL